jgi:dipeptidyl aminopeptidase/acylaminoacyl peptidase
MLKRSVVFSGLLFFFRPAVAEDPIPISALDVSRTRQVLEVCVDPSGSWIAYAVSEPSDPFAGNWPSCSCLSIIEQKTGRTQTFVERGPVTDIAFRPGHGSITFLSRREGDRAQVLYEIPLQGGEARVIYAHKTSIASYEWAADGKKLAFFTARPSSGTRSVLNYTPRIFEENLANNKGYWVELPDGPLHELSHEGHFYQLSWSPDGTRLAAISAPTSLVDHSYMRRQLYILDPDSAGNAAIVEHRAKFDQAVWSPDGRQIAFIAGADLHDPTAGRLFIASSEGGAPRRLLPAFEGKLEEVIWDGPERLLVLASEGVYKSVLQLDTEGRLHKRVVERCSMALNHVSASENGHLVFSGSTAEHPAEVMVLENGSKTLRRITDSNPWLNERRMAVQEVVRWPARDGLLLEGLLIRPLDAEPGRMYPLITVIHGGPESHYSNGWLTAYNMPGQLAAAQGYAVFYPNYRGSTGRGEVFAKTSQGDPAGREFDDIVDGIDHLIATGLVDRSKVGVTGGSYGGYATAWMSTFYSERFAAGVMSVGISNEISKWGTSDIPEEFYLVHARKQIWEDWEFFLKRSPIYYAGQAKTPLLIMHGENDTRVHPSQSLELYRHISTRTDTPVRLVFYPGEGHGNRGAAARLDYNLRMMQWFDQFLLRAESDKPVPEIGNELLTPTF